MTWLALCDFSNSFFSPLGISHPSAVGGSKPSDEQLLAKGSLVIEISTLEENSNALELINYYSVSDWGTQLKISLTQNDAVILRHIQGSRQITLETGEGALVRAQPSKIIFSWDAPQRWGQLTIENLDDGSVHTKDVSDPLPVPVVDVHHMTMSPESTRAVSEVLFFTFSDQIEEHGLIPGIVASSPLETPNGPELVQNLRVGDLVSTLDSGPQPIRCLMVRDVPAHGHYQPLRLRAPYFELNQDIMVARNLRLLVEGDMVEYLFGEEEVLINAQHLQDTYSVLPETRLKTIRYYQLLFDRPEILNVAGSSVESLFRPQPSGEEFTDGLPVHTEPSRPVLRPFEAYTLKSMRAG